MEVESLVWHIGSSLVILWVAIAFYLAKIRAESYQKSLLPFLVGLGSPAQRRSFGVRSFLLLEKELQEKFSLNVALVLKSDSYDCPEAVQSLAALLLELGEEPKAPFAEAGTSGVTLSELRQKLQKAKSVRFEFHNVPAPIWHVFFS